MRKSVAILLTRAPYGRIHLSEGLRAAGGIAAGFDHHDVTVIFTGEAAYGARSAVDREALNMPDQIEDIEENDGRLLVDRSALVARDIQSVEIAEDVTIVSDAEVTETIHDAEEVLTF